MEEVRKRTLIALPENIKENLRKFSFPQYMSYIISEKELRIVQNPYFLYLFQNKITEENSIENNISVVRTKPSRLIVFLIKGEIAEPYVVNKSNVINELAELAGPIVGEKYYLDGSIGPYVIRIDPDLIRKLNQQIEKF